ncbi:unnamed protein product [Allacma fusca]|uniref:Uncharacterized protein n=1 Tax=Allacma fusca TaxID=39272 RepID=A0A8J2LHJ0_9HEXA|nr:unnamed protein product [Allacma fusca]
MADHVKANSSKGAGKTPRVPRTRRRSRSKSGDLLTAPAEDDTAGGDTSSTREIGDLSLSKKPKIVREQPQTHNQTKSDISNSFAVICGRIVKNKESSNSGIKRSHSKESTSGGPIRKRKVEAIGGSVAEGAASLAAIEGSDSGERGEEESTTTDHEEEIASSQVTPSGIPGKDVQTVEVEENKKHRTAACNISRNIRHSLTAKKSTKGKSKLNNQVSTQNSQSSTLPQDKSESISSSISSRLRLTPSRAAAASQKAALTATSESSISSIPTNTSVSSTQSCESKSKSSSKQFRFSKKKQHIQKSAQVATATTTDTDDPEELERRNLPGPSRSFKDRFPYQLRSRAGSETTNYPSCPSSKDKSRKTSVGILKSAHILSEKEKTLKKKGNFHGRSDNSGSSRSGGRGGSLQTASSSNTTGSCASSSSSFKLNFRSMMALIIESGKKINVMS